MDWEELQKNISRLCEKVDFNPDIIAAVAKGGVIPAVLVSKKLGVKDMYAITVKKSEGKRKVMTKFAEDLAGKKVLLVEDAVETGKSMLTAKKYLESKGALVKTMAVLIKGNSRIKPDYVIDSIEETNFPWEEVKG